MCGRFTLTLSSEAFEQAMKETYGLDIEASAAALPRYNIAPDQQVHALIHDGEGYRLKTFTWGMPTQGGRANRTLVNARAETVQEKPRFKESFLDRRCLILADGYYEWKQNGPGKTPMRIFPASRKLFTMAGLYEPYTTPSGRKDHRCVIITTEAGSDVADIHHRMPRILSAETELDWVHPKHREEPRILASVLTSPVSESLEHHPVSTLVNSPSNDSEACIRTVKAFSQTTLFDTM